jgi:hypothetical protein
MNIALDLKHINLENIFFMETKRNVIIDGKFTKLLYSNSVMSTNGIYIHTPLISRNNYKTNNKTTFYISSSDSVNIHIVNNLCRIESRIIDAYGQHSCSRKSPIYSLKEQLNQLCFKTFHEMNMQEGNQTYILRISGIWENETSVGITYRFNTVSTCGK